MKKENLYTLFYGISLLLLVGFCIRLGVDYAHYDDWNHSAPFYVFILARAATFLLPSIVAYLVARFLRKKYAQKK